MKLPTSLQPFTHLISFNQPLKNFTYMKVGGPADLLALAKSKTELIDLIHAANQAHFNYYILGSGSNTIFSDSGFRGLIIINRTSALNCNQSTSCITAESGVITNILVNKSIQAGLAGLELFLGIPGTLGGALYNNSHYSNELIADHIVSINLLKTDGTVREEPKSYFQFSYDNSILQNTHELILDATFQLTPDHSEALSQKAQAALRKRRQTQPLELPSSGCIFKNPPNSSSGALIDQAGLKGYRIGDAEISSVHANFIVNKGNATSQDIIELSEHIIDVIHSKYGLTLKREVFFINEFGERINS